MPTPTSKFELSDKAAAMEPFPELFITPERGSAGQAHHRLLRLPRFLLEYQLLAVLADHVRLPDAGHSALEMKLGISSRYVHHIGGLPDFSALRFTKYNQYESMILPHGEVSGGLTAFSIHYGVQVTNVQSSTAIGDTQAGHPRQIVLCRGRPGANAIDLIGERPGVHHQRRLRGELLPSAARTHAPDPSGVNTQLRRGSGWDMWKKIAAQAEPGSFGHPDKFCSDSRRRPTG